ncbi:hypothetical protein [Pseudomarimonas arenosa]|uniref:Uncharacterized protein n=1 Tax=Pseudomarimonas arenosa TaxID=2774145 RepID=A0AAW3ZST8_9GAMM|nr:hypothetical protein [Pseudomarimonas arenosa]MBD8527920.1 hypothetical protein [Pseudomarimonas arenosa]
MKSADEIDRAKFETAVRTTRLFLARLQQHCEPEVAQLALWTVALEAGEIDVGREQLSVWLSDLSARLNAEIRQENTTQ